jgi:uncharacterized protein
VKITFDPVKRDVTLEERGLDFADVAEVIIGMTATNEDRRYDYGEPRFQTYGLLQDRLVMFAWTPIDGGLRVISMRKCNDKEQARFAARMG